MRIIEEQKDHYVNVENESLSVWADKKQRVFFENNLKLSWQNNAYRLSSPEGILNPVITNRDLHRQDID